MDYLLGIGYQWIRAQKKVSEWWTPVAVVLVGSLTYWLSADFAWTDLRAFITGAVPYMQQVIVGFGGTSVVANLAVSSGANPSHLAIPATDSKG